MFKERVREHPERLAVSFGAEHLTYRQLDQAGNRLAHRLAAWGVGPEGRVAVWVAPGLGIIIALLGILKAGATYVPINPDFPVERIKAINLNVAGLDHDPGSLRLYPLAVSVDLVGPNLETRFVCSSNLHGQSSLERLSARFDRDVQDAVATIGRNEPAE